MNPKTKQVLINIIMSEPGCQISASKLFVELNRRGFCAEAVVGTADLLGIISSESKDTIHLGKK